MAIETPKDFTKAVDDTYDRMGRIPCACAAIGESHVKDDCLLGWHKSSWHHIPLFAVGSIQERRLTDGDTCEFCAQ